MTTITVPELLRRLAEEAATETPAPAPERLPEPLPADEPPTTPLPRIPGQRRFPPVPIRVRVLAGVTAGGVVASGLLASDATTEIPHADPPTDAELFLDLAPMSAQEATAHIAQEVAAEQRAQADTAAAQAIQADAEQAELDRRAAEEAARLAAEERARQESQEAAREAAEARVAQEASEAAQGATLTPGSGRNAIVPGSLRTSGYGSRWGTFHYGIDLAAPLGTPIYTPRSGVVVAAGPASGFGNWVGVQLANGDVLIFGHMRTYTVSVGDRVNAGDLIAYVGSEGQSTGPHCHVEVRLGGLNGTRIDPGPYLGI